MIRAHLPSLDTTYWKGITQGLAIAGFQNPVEHFGMAQFCNDPRVKSKVNCELVADPHNIYIMRLLPLKGRTIISGEELLISYQRNYWIRAEDNAIGSDLIG